MKTFPKVLLFFIIIGFVSCISEDKDNSDDTINYLVKNDKIPQFTVPGLESNTFNSNSFIGKKSFLVFYITTCPYCRRELTEIEEVWQELKDDPAYQFVTISREESADVVKTYWENNKLTVPTYLDSDRSVFKQFANQTVPRSYFIDKKGIINEFKTEELTAKEILEMLKKIPD